MLRNWTASVHTLQHVQTCNVTRGSKCYAMDCFGTYFTRCPNLYLDVTRVPSATGMDCFGTYFTHVQTCNVTRVPSATAMDCFGTYFTHVQTCNVTRVPIWRLPLPVTSEICECYAMSKKKVWIGECIRCIQKKNSFFGKHWIEKTQETE